MPLQRGEVRGFNFDRMVVEFTMLNSDKVIECAISTAAMDDLEGQRGLKADQRVDQFIRLREVIEEQASRKFFDEQVRVDRPVVLRSNDFSIVASLKGPHRG
jgi:zona occludens toxin (predicted ATPase)